MEELKTEKDKIISNLQKEVKKLSDERQSLKADLVSIHHAKRSKKAELL
jgi:cupin superfamily acireductone dioxygenase involved in methionine salvage